jgi:hypothetical protein
VTELHNSAQMPVSEYGSGRLSHQLWYFLLSGMSD